MALQKVSYCIFLFVFLSSYKQENKTFIEDTNSIGEYIEVGVKVEYGRYIDYKKLFEDNLVISKSFHFPVGKPNAIGYYNAQKFKVNNHLGDDWNNVGGGNTDLGDTFIQYLMAM